MDKIWKPSLAKKQTNKQNIQATVQFQSAQNSATNSKLALPTKVKSYGKVKMCYQEEQTYI